MQLNDLKLPTSERKRKKMAALTNFDKKIVTDDFLQRQADSIENVQTKSRNVYRSPRTDFSHYIHTQSPKFDKVESKLGIRH